jgi:DNA-directed RNA polymerase subunit RPC12/RpoP
VKVIIEKAKYNPCAGGYTYHHYEGKPCPKCGTEGFLKKGTTGVICPKCKGKGLVGKIKEVPRDG